MYVRADSNYAYVRTYCSGIMLVAEKCLKLFQHIRRQAILGTLVSAAFLFSRGSWWLTG